MADKNRLYSEMHHSNRQQTGWKIALGGLICLFFIQPVAFGVSAQQARTEKDTQRVLNLEAANALWRLQKALKEEGFYSADTF